MSDIIAAIATGGGFSAIGIVRISGFGAVRVADKVFRMASGGRLVDTEPRKMHYGGFYSQSSDTLIDLCLCVISRGSSGFTGEETVEFHCHGSPVVLSEILHTLFAHGVRQAQPGEFTKRAFLNGKLDLTQAEAIIDLIEADTPIAARNAAGQLGGAVSGRLEPIYSALVDIMAHFHAVLDYPDEDIEEFKLQDYIAVLEDSENTLHTLMSSHERGRIMRDGVQTAIVGRPNSGKSSLLNALLGYDRAIVTEIAGTTRDTVEEKLLIGNVVLRLIDTAGLRHTDETIEKLGVERSISALKKAELVLLVIDSSKDIDESDFDILLSAPPEVPKIIVFNKNDLITEQESGSRESNSAFCIPNSALYPTVHVSALTGEGLSDLEAEVKKLFENSDTASEGEIITNARQFDALTRAKSSISEAISAMTSSMTPDAILTEIEAALHCIGEVTGKTMREDIVSRIFERFCVGK